MEIWKQVEDSIRIREGMLADKDMVRKLEECINLIVSTFENGGKVLFCGNGGSAADAQHLAAELSGRFYFDREPLNAEALHVNSSFVTATANDHHFDAVYERMVKAVGKKGDVLIALSTSGKSKNIIKAIKAANAMGMQTIGFSGSTGGDMNEHCRLMLRIPSDDTPRIQEMHMLLGHIICENVERILFKK